MLEYKVENTLNKCANAYLADALQGHGPVVHTLCSCISVVVINLKGVIE